MSSNKFTNLFGVDIDVNRQTLMKMTLDDKLERYVDCFAFDKLIDSRCSKTPNYKIFKSITNNASSKGKKYILLLESMRDPSMSTEISCYILDDVFKLTLVDPIPDTDVLQIAQNDVKLFVDTDVYATLQNFDKFSTDPIDKKLRYIMYNAELLRLINYPNIVSYLNTTIFPIRYLTSYLFGYDGTFTANLKENILVGLIETNNVFGFFSELYGDTKYKIDYDALDMYDRFLVQSKSFKYETYTDWLNKIKRKVLDKILDVINIKYEQSIDLDNNEMMNVYVTSYDLVINGIDTISITASNCENFNVVNVDGKTLDVVLSFSMFNRKVKSLDAVVKNQILKMYDVKDIKITGYDFVEDKRLGPIVKVKTYVFTNRYLLNAKTQQQYTIVSDESVKFPDENKNLVNLLIDVDVTNPHIEEDMSGYDFAKLNTVISSNTSNTRTRVLALTLLVKRINTFYERYDIGTQILGLFMVLYFRSGNNVFTSYDYLLNKLDISTKPYTANSSVYEMVLIAGKRQRDDEVIDMCNHLTSDTEMYFRTISGDNNGISGMCVEYTAVDLLNYFYLERDMGFDFEKMKKNGLHPKVIDFYKRCGNFANLRDNRSDLVQLFAQINGNANVSARNMAEFDNLLTKLYGETGMIRSGRQIVTENLQPGDSITTYSSSNLTINGLNNIDFSISGQHAKTIIQSSLPFLNKLLRLFATDTYIGTIKLDLKDKVANLTVINSVFKTFLSAKDESNTILSYDFKRKPDEIERDALMRFYVTVISTTLKKQIGTTDLPDETLIPIRENITTFNFLNNKIVWEYLINIIQYLEKIQQNPKKTKTDLFVEASALEIVESLKRLEQLLIIVAQNSGESDMMYAVKRNQQIKKYNVAFMSSLPNNSVFGYAKLIKNILGTYTNLPKIFNKFKVISHPVSMELNQAIQRIVEKINIAYNIGNKTESEISEFVTAYDDSFEDEDFAAMYTHYVQFTGLTIELLETPVEEQIGGGDGNMISIQRYKYRYLESKYAYSQLSKMR